MSGIQILFADHEGQPVPLKPGVPDAVANFALDDASERFGRSKESLTRLYKAFFSQFDSDAPNGLPAITLSVASKTPSPESLQALWRVKFAVLSWQQFLDIYEECRQRRLNAWCDHVVAKLEHDPLTGRPKVRLLVRIQGLRALGRRTGECLGRKGPYWRGIGQKWARHWDDENSPPSMARVGISRRGDITPTWGVAFWKSHAAFVLNDRGERVLDPYWQKMGPHMLAKCAEADAWRAAFPELADLYTVEEMMQADNPKPIIKEHVATEGRHIVDELGNEIHESMRPRTRFEFEQALQRLGMDDPESRVRTIERFRLKAPDLYDADPRGFYQLVLGAVRQEQLRHHTHPADHSV